MGAKPFIGALLLTAVLLAAGLSACGAAHEATAPTNRDLAITPGGVTLDGHPLTLSELDSRLAAAARLGDRVRLEVVRSARFSAASLTPGERARVQALQDRVLAMAARRGVSVVRFTMPVRGSASPVPSAQ